MHAATLPPALAEVARGRDHLTTAETAHALGKAAKTLRKLHCLDGEAFGIRPVKIGNELRWPVAKIAALLRGETLK